MSSKILFVCKATLLCFCSIIISSLFVETSQSADSVLGNSERGFSETGIGEIVKNDFSTESLWFGFDESVTIASKMEEDINSAPSVVTVITAEQIENMGGKFLTDILRMVPGFDIIKDADFGIVRYSSRGLSGADEKIKVFIDGHSINLHFDGSAATFFDDLPVKNIKRVEIIRGPGSALYGANAFLAVINIITKSASDIDGFSVTSGFGSYDTQEYSISFGKKVRDIDITGFADFYNTNGLSDTIKEDAISGLPFLNNFSLTPGDTDDSRNRLDLYVKMAYKDLEFKAKYMNKDTEAFVGPSFVLTDDSDQQFNYVMADLSYKYNFGEKLTVKPRVYYDQYDFRYFEEAMPDGFTIPLDRDRDGDIEQFPDGMIGDAFATARRVGSEIDFFYKLFDGNTVTLGFNYEWERLDNVQFDANFDPLTQASIGAVQDVSDTNWIRRAYRQIWAVYFQNKWDITDDIGVTLGVRHDHYSDFKGTTNPRIGIVWDFIDNASLKLLYGQAFRAPNFGELYSTNNPVFIGNPDLDPETIRTYEVVLEYKFSKYVQTNLNYFFNVVRDQIGVEQKSSPLESQAFSNENDSNIQGIEFEAKADLSDYWPDLYAFVNYTYQDAESHGDPLPDVAKHKGNVGINAGITKYLNANLHAFISGSRIREEADSRDDSPGYAILNLTLTAKNFFKDMQIKASMDNLLDKDYNDPTPINTIPTDIPRPGRTFFIELAYEF